MSLKLLADVGLVGMPNAGKSTLISTVSAAKPKIADYPFTTLVPNLGVVSYGGGYNSFVMADIPGLIEGASIGQGLGTRFLKHVERTDLFLHLVDLSDLQPGDPLANFDMINKELAIHSSELAAKEQMIVITKIDLPDVRDRLPKALKFFAKRKLTVFPTSSATGEGIQDLVNAVALKIETRRAERNNPGQTTTTDPLL